MTNEEAIKKITHIKYCYAYEGDYEAFDMAIKALSADIEEDVARRIATIIENEQDMRVVMKNADRPIGEWEYHSNPALGINPEDAFCPYCKYHIDTTMVDFDDYNFCPNCGAYMKGENK